MVMKMVKAVFIDFMGTLVSDTSPYAYQVIKHCFENSNMESFEATYACWLRYHDALLEKYNGDMFKKEYDICVENFHTLKELTGLVCDIPQMLALLEQHWMYAPVFEDVKDFFASCPLPIYLVTNNDTKYIEEGLRALNLKPTGIISSEGAGYYKPRKEIFQKALEIAGAARDEVIHIGDSQKSDVQGAQSAGIRPILLDREGKHTLQGVTIIRSLKEVPEVLAGRS